MLEWLGINILIRDQFGYRVLLKNKLNFYYSTGQIKHLEKSLEICNRQSLGIHDKLLLVFLKHCLHTMPTRNLEEVLIKMEFSNLIQNDNQFYDNLVFEIYENVPGTNHNVLIAYYTALNLIYPANRVQCKDSMTPIQHIKLLKRVHSTIPGKHFEPLRLFRKGMFLFFYFFSRYRLQVVVKSRNRL